MSADLTPQQVEELSAQFEALSGPAKRLVFAGLVGAVSALNAMVERDTYDDVAGEIATAAQAAPKI